MFSMQHTEMAAPIHHRPQIFFKSPQIQMPPGSSGISYILLTLASSQLQLPPSLVVRSIKGIEKGADMHIDEMASGKGNDTIRTRGGKAKEQTK